MGCEVTLFDISDEQLKIAKSMIEEKGLQNCINDFIQGDIRDLSMLADGSFDVVVCYGAPLSYVLEGRDIAVHEFQRVLKKGGTAE